MEGASLFSDATDDLSQDMLASSASDGDLLPPEEKEEARGGESSLDDMLPSEPSDGGASLDMLPPDSGDGSGDEAAMDVDGTPSPERALAPEGLQFMAQMRPHQWASGVLQCLSAFLPQHVLKQSLLLNAPTLTTHFSGIGTTEWAARSLAGAAAAAIGFPVSIRPLSACESCRACQGALRQVLPPGACVFDDILSVSPPAAKLYADLEKTGGDLDLDSAWGQIRRAGARPRWKCQAHSGAQCETARPDLDVSGSPCQPWSRAGANRGQRSHLMVLFLCWVLWARARRPLVLVHENVVGFDRALLRRFLGDLYDVVIFRVQPSHVGFPFVGRKRVYAILLLRGGVRTLADPSALYERVRQAFVLHVPPASLDMSFIASDASCLAEENRWRSRRGMGALAQPSPDWGYLLTETQTRYLDRYCTQWSARHHAPADLCIFDLSQDPDAGSRGRSSESLPTVTTKSCRMWAPRLRRWLLPLELAWAHGYPVTPGAARDACLGGGEIAQGVCSIARLGNCMHVANVGAAVAVTLACVSRA